MTHELICSCGHEQSAHTGFSDVEGGDYPFGCAKSLELDKSSCLCWWFVADNLKYLEILSDNKSK